MTADEHRRLVNEVAALRTLVEELRGELRQDKETRREWRSLKQAARIEGLPADTLRKRCGRGYYAATGRQRQKRPGCAWELLC